MRWAKRAASSTWREVDRVLRRQPAVDQLLQRAALDVLHRDVVGAVELAAVEDGDDVRVLEAGRRLGLAAEALDELAVLGEAAVQDLQRDLALQVGVLGSQTSAIPPEPILRTTR